MNRISAALLAIPMLALGPPPSEAASYYVWQGTAMISTASSQCLGASERERIVGGSEFTSVVRPPNVGSSNGTLGRISFNHNDRAEFGMILSNGLNYNSATPALYAAFGANASGVLEANFSGTYSGFSLSPTQPQTTTPFITLQGTVNNFMFITGCTVTFHASYVRRYGS